MHTHCKPLQPRLSHWKAGATAECLTWALWLCCAHCFCRHQASVHLQSLDHATFGLAPGSGPAQVAVVQPSGNLEQKELAGLHSTVQSCM